MTKDRRQMKHDPINAEQQSAIDQYAIDHGADWKLHLETDWARCGSRWSGPYHLLHQLRNSHGPKWLVDYNDDAVRAAYYDHLARYPEAEGPL